MSAGLSPGAAVGALRGSGGHRLGTLGDRPGSIGRQGLRGRLVEVKGGKALA